MQELVFADPFDPDPSLIGNSASTSPYSTTHHPTSGGTSPTSILSTPAPVGARHLRAFLSGAPRLGGLAATCGGVASRTQPLLGKFHTVATPMYNHIFRQPEDSCSRARRRWRWGNVPRFLLSPLWRCVRARMEVREEELDPQKKCLVVVIKIGFFRFTMQTAAFRFPYHPGSEPEWIENAGQKIVDPLFGEDKVWAFFRRSSRAPANRDALPPGALRFLIRTPVVTMLKSLEVLEGGKVRDESVLYSSSSMETIASVVFLLAPVESDVLVP